VIQIRNMSLCVAKTFVLKDVNLTLEKGKIIGLIGPKNSVKSALLKLLGGCLGNYTGEVIIDGLAVSHLTKSIVSFLPKANFLDYWMSTKGVFDLYKNMFSDFDEVYFLELLDKFDVDPTKSIKKMTVQMRNHFQFALIMSRRANVYLLDEPLSSVDLKYHDELIRMIKEKSGSGCLVIISSESMVEIGPIADSLIFIKDGEVIQLDDVNSVLMKEGKTISQLYSEVILC
jgi:ABC-2 type transport system ATP-binding protein